jgi:hypothetical protein
MSLLQHVSEVILKNVMSTVSQMSVRASMHQHV